MDLQGYLLGEERGTRTGLPDPTLISTAEQLCFTMELSDLFEGTHLVQSTHFN